MTGAARVAAILIAMLAAAACATSRQAGPASPATPVATLAADLDHLFESPVLARSLVAARVESLEDGRVLYERNGSKLVVPASALKIITIAAAAERLGWDFAFDTRLEAAGRIVDGTLRGDLVVTGGGDPSIGSLDDGHAQLFLDWADALHAAGISRVDGRLIGDDDAFDDERLGAGWAWDYLAAGYAAPVSALSYNENVAVVRVSPGDRAAAAATVTLTPPGHLLAFSNEVTTGEAGSVASLTLLRPPGHATLVVRGSVPAGGPVAIRTAAVENPTMTFLEGLRLALAHRGIVVEGGAWDVDDVVDRPAEAGRRSIAVRTSPPLSALAGYAMKVSQNFYGEMFLKAIGRTTGRQGSAASGRAVVQEVLADWGIPPDAVVMYDGSGLSRYNYVTVDALGAVLRQVWNDERLRGPFVAALPVGGHDGTLRSRMRDRLLDRRVQAKTGTIANVRSLSGYVETDAGEKLAFSIVVNHFTAPSGEIDAVVDQALMRLVE